VKAERTISTLVHCGITHVVGVPDNTSGALFDVIRRHPTIRIVTTTREGEAIALASGLWLGHAAPLVLIQNTGLLESGDALRGTAMRMGAAVPLVITGRGYAKMASAGVGPETPRTPELMTRPDVDSTALLTEPTLDAWGVPWSRCEGADDPADAIRRTVDAAREREWPTALILARGLT
jgi:sulfopyruvate decarboxylase subunit alpha